MQRYRGQKALYEAINRVRARSGLKKPEPLRAQGPQPAVPSVPPVSTPQEVVRPSVAKPRWQKPSPVQINNGRVEFALPYPIAVAVVLALLVVVAMAWRIGRLNGAQADASASTARPEASQPIRPKAPAQPKQADRITASEPRTTPGPVAGAAPAGTGAENAMAASVGSDAKGVSRGNYLLIEDQPGYSNFGPLAKYLSDNGLATEIVHDKARGRYLLVTAERFGLNSPAQALLQKKLAELGPKYKAPAGYQGFGDRLGMDAYPRTFKEDFQGEVIHVD